MVVVNKSPDKETFISFPSGTVPSESLKRTSTLTALCVFFFFFCFDFKFEIHKSQSKVTSQPP